LSTLRVIRWIGRIRGPGINRSSANLLSWHFAASRVFTMALMLRAPQAGL
jgi:hypothetical protein